MVEKKAYAWGLPPPAPNWSLLWGAQLEWECIPPAHPTAAARLGAGGGGEAFMFPGGGAELQEDERPTLGASPTNNPCWWVRTGGLGGAGWHLKEHPLGNGQWRHFPVLAKGRLTIALFRIGSIYTV